MVNIKQQLLNMDGYIYRSTNYGVTWTQATSDTSRNWYSVAMSSDGKYQTAVVMEDISIVQRIMV
jgi:hypothetical protein